MWTYIISTGELFHDGDKVAVGYAGGGVPPLFNAKYKNNVNAQGVHNYGPLPCGNYTIEQPINGTHLGPSAMRLTAAPSNVMYGRDGFFMHADSVRNPGQASEGCIVLDMVDLLLVSHSGDHALVVLAQSTNREGK